MNIFELVKQRIRFSYVAGDYGITFNSSLKANCPFHEDRTPSFHDYGTHGYCFACNKIADVIDLEAQYKGISPYDAVLSLAQRYDVDLPENGSSFKEHFNKRIEALKLLERFAVYANKRIKNNPEVIEVLKSKGLDTNDVDRYLIGFVGNENPISTTLRNEPDKNCLLKRLASSIGMGIISKTE